MTLSITAAAARCFPPFHFVGGSCVFVDGTTQASWSSSRQLCDALGAGLVMFQDLHFFVDVVAHVQELGGWWGAGWYADVSGSRSWSIRVDKTTGLSIMKYAY